MRVGGELYALPVAHVCEIARAEPVAPVPGSGAALAGVRNLRGQVLPVFDLATLMGVQGGDRGRHVVIEHGGVRAGIAVDRVSDVATLPEAREAADSELLSGAVLGDGRLIGILDVDRLVAALAQGAA